MLKKNLVLLLALIQASVILAQSNPTFKIIKSIPLPGNDGWDFSAVDEKYDRLFVSHGSLVQVIDLKTDSLIGEIQNTPGVHGIAFAYELDEGFTSNGDNNTVTFFNLKNLSTTKTVSVTGTDPDGIVYDSVTKRVFTFNGHSGNATVIDAKTGAVMKTIDLGGSPEFAIADGTGFIYDNLEKESMLIKINARTFNIESRFPLSPCGGPTGLAFDAQDQLLFTGCRTNKGLSVVNAASGKILATLTIGSGVDAVCFDPETKLIYVSNKDGSLNIFHQDDSNHYSPVQTLTTKPHSKTMALDTKTHLAYLSSADFVANDHIINGSFQVLVVAK